MALNTCLFFDGQCEEPFRRYENVPDGKLAGLMRLRRRAVRSPALEGCSRIVYVSSPR